MMTTSHVVVGGRRVAWTDLIDAARQDSGGTAFAARHWSGLPLGREANGETTLAARYREVLRGLLPAARAACQSAYADYCACGVVVDRRLAGGHGTVIAGPDRRRQDEWQAWDRLVRAIEEACS